MERGKASAKRGPKIKALPPPGDFIALGSKSNRPPTTPENVPEPKLTSSQLKSSSLQLPSSSSDRKREAPGPPASNPTLAKKPKVAAGSSLGIVSRPVTSKKEKETKKNEQWDTVATDVDPEEFINQIQEVEERGVEVPERIERLLCGAAKYLRSNRAKPEQSLYLSLLYLAKIKPVYFRTDYSREAFSSLLKREVSLSFKSKGNALVSVLAANVLMAAYQDEKNWPEVIFTVYLEDALGDRIWVDHDECKVFVANIQTAFNTKMPAKNLLPPELSFKMDVCPSPPPLLIEEEDTTESFASTDSKDKADIPVIPRFTHCQEQIEQYMQDILRDQIARRQPMENISRNVLRLLTCACGIGEVRSHVAQRLEIWLQNPKLMRPAQDLLLSVCLNCNQRCQQDVEIISHLVKIRLKNKALLNHYLLCMRELLNQHQENLEILLKHTIYNELSNSRNPNNMVLLGVMFQYSPDQTPKILASVFQDLLISRDDYLRALRALFREIVRSLRYDVNFSAFCLGLLQDRKESHFWDLETQIKERMFLSIADLITLSIFMGITPAVREAASAYARGDKKDMSVLRNYQQLVATVQRDAVWWLHTIVPRMYKPQRPDFLHCIHKIMFMEQAEHYHNKDNWPPENDRHMMLRLASETPVLENTLTRVLIIGLSKEHPLNASEAHDLAEQLVKRAASIYTEDFQAIQVDSVELMDILFNLCTYHHPENITLPSGYKPPNLAISSLYWKAWIMLLIITAHNPKTFGLTAWETFPTLRSFIEMCITNHFTFPPPTMAVGEKADEIKSHELRITHIEKQAILEFETHLANASASTKTTITEDNSLLLPQLITMDPSGVARKPPANVLDQLKTLNQSLKLGHLLCRSRDPDFLLEIIQRQGTSQSMPWLADLVESSEGAFNMLPVQCLCEFLLNEPPAGLRSLERDREDKEETKSEKEENSKRKEKHRKQRQLLDHLQSLLHEANDDPRQTCEVLDYFLRRLSSQQSSARNQAIIGLKLVISPSKQEDEEDDDEDMNAEKDEMAAYHWLLKHLPNLAHFEAVRADASQYLRQACLVETNPWAVSAYIQFLANFAPDDQLQDLADLGLNMAQLIVDRTTVLNYILPSEIGQVTESKVTTLQALMIIFLKYLRKSRKHSKEAYSWSESQDQIMVQWQTGEVATMHILVVHAMVILLTYGPSESTILFDELLEIWFPSTCDPPQAFLVDTSEEALLLPDWLKLRMIRSNVDVLVDAALHDLDPSQLILFIQSFGIPITSVSKLLQALDQAVEIDSEAVDQAVLDKSYMSQLVDVQQQRGAFGGLKFAELLDEGSQMQQEYLESPVVSPRHREPSPLVLPMPTMLTNSEAICNQLIYLLHLDLNVTVTAEEQQNIFRSLLKTLTKESQLVDRPVTVSIITILDQMVSGCDGKLLTKALHQCSSFTCPLFRMMLISLLRQNHRLDHGNMLIGLYEKILAQSSDIRSPLTSILKQAVRGNKRKSAERNEKLVSNSAEPFNEAKLIQDIENAAQLNIVHLEKVVGRLVSKALEAKSSAPLTSAIAKLLMKDTAIKAPAGSLFVDWLQLLEPETVNMSPELERQLLLCHFGKTSSKSSHSSKVASLRPHLLTALTHQASWETIQQCLLKILQPIHLNSFEPSAVLDFVWACIYIPKIWQGRDKHIPKHYVEENILGCSMSQIRCITNYILEEILLLVKVERGGDSTLHQEDSAQRDLLESQSFLHRVIKLMELRLPLVIHCCNNKNDLLQDVVEHLLNIIEEKGLKSLLARFFLQQLYLKVPQLINWFKGIDRYLQECGKMLSTSSKLDVISQTLLTALASNDVGKNWSDRFQDIELACRKMAACHPNLLLRQLSMLSALLRGRTQLDFPVFKTRHHLLFFKCVLGLLELLQPYIFQNEYSSALEKTLDSYFDLIKNHALHQKELGGLVNRFLLLLQNFIMDDSQRAVKYIQKFSSLLHDLSSMHPEMQSLRCLLAGVSLPTQAGDGFPEELAPTLLSFTPTQVSPARIHAQMAPLLARLSKGNTMDDLSSALQELDNLSKRKPELLEPFVDDLKRLLSNSSEHCRNFAHNLMIRHIKQNPRSCGEFLNAFLICLDDDQQDVVNSALERLAEFVILSQENATILLEKTFNIGITSNINTLPYITETIMLLHMQSGS